MKNLHRALTVTMAAGGLALAAAGGASAESAAHGNAVRSPGVGSGNLVQAPVHVPVKVCGATVDVVGLLNPAFTPPCPTA
ncbi:chaplin [Streptomyces sp. NPDC059740]|uniref:chaplin n=1 Tax=Streptomyces sp. NPDC059740 TaxID=3346926 RepID=UPI00364E2368